MLSQNIAYRVSLTLGDHADDFDIDAIVEEIQGTYGADLDSIPSAEYWALVDRNDTTA